MIKKQLTFNLITAAVFLIMGCFTAVTTKAQTLPAPDFSAMEQYYEIVKWSYDDTGSLKIIVKPKEDPPHTHRAFVVRYFDADGVDLRDYNGTQIVGLGYGTPAGQLEKTEAGAPYESEVRKVKKVVVYRVRDEGSLAEPPADQQKKSAPDNRENGNSAAKQEVLANDGANENGGCSFAAQPAVSAGAKFSEALIKSVLYERYASGANTGSLTSPGAIGIAFLNINIGKSYTNAVTNTARGAERKQDGAPPNAAIYPFSAKFIVCQKYSKEIVKKQIESDFVCFKDKTGNWNCPVNGVPKTVYLK